MSKTKLVKHIKSELNCDVREAIKLVDSFTKCLILVLVKQDEVLLQGFGRFDKTLSNARPERSPSTGQAGTRGSTDLKKL